MITAAEVRLLAAELESDRIERTLSTTDTDKFREAICAFANDMPDNRCPGYLILGVDDRGHIPGVAVTDQLLQNLAQRRDDGRIQPIPTINVARVDMGGGKSALVDTFAGGRLLGLDEAKDRVANHFGNQVEWSPRLIEPVTNRYWITRILQNLLTSYGKTGQYAEISAVLEMELLLWPEESRLQRDLAVVLARVGKQDLASEWLEHYLHNNPEDPNGADLRQLLASLS